MRNLSGSLLALVFFGALARGAPNEDPTAVPAASTKGFREVALPYIEKNCIGCHGEKKAQAGFRIDKLGPDFSAAKMAEQWKEVIDRINAGEMPPEGRLRPDAKESAAFTTWVNGQLRDVEL